MTTSQIYSTNEYIVEIATGNDDIIIATSNNNGTTNLYSIREGNSEQILANSSIAGLAWNGEVFTWQADGSLYSYSPITGSVEEVITSDTALSSSYEFITNGDQTAVVWTESTEDGYIVKASFLYDNTWSSPVVLLSGQDDSIAFMDAQMLSDDSISLIMNAVSYGYTGDIYCAVCGNKLENGKVIPKADHSFKWVIDKAPSETEEGLKHEECSCGEKRNENTVIFATGTHVSPPTGDTSQLLLWISLIVSGVAIVGILCNYRRKRSS